jgi:hypothetical protein
MTLRSILATLTLATVPMLGFLRATEARPMQGAGNAAIAACKQKCLEQYNKNVENCKKTAKVCDLWILWTCFAAHTNEDVLENCLATAEDTLEACLAACVPQA